MCPCFFFLQMTGFSKQYVVSGCGTLPSQHHMFVCIMAKDEVQCSSLCDTRARPCLIHRLLHAPVCHLRSLCHSLTTTQDAPWAVKLTKDVRERAFEAAPDLNAIAFSRVRRAPLSFLSFLATTACCLACLDDQL